MVLLVYAFFIILNIIAYLIPKKLTKAENYVTSIFALLFGISVDLVLNLKYELYGYFGPGFQWWGFIGEFLYFIPINILFLNSLPSSHRIGKILIYIIIWSLSSVALESLIIKTDFFNYNNWHLWYSAVIYPFVFFILYLQFKYVRKLMKISDQGELR
ncbi:hypothetical protein J2Z40_003331 [Cytobacillus eiseniae]|uniref:Rod shape-determining protein MreD n=1 Tax=Cytobacillus eiseniae TaxID=762947 RepID=A0ABS4RIR1_9BACI|nr:hypothetical protein [Cytobacillus eiseniae]MBP2242751.1 hypothetical protein [Cytobacillus eiseniae]